MQPHVPRANIGGFSHRVDPSGRSDRDPELRWRAAIRQALCRLAGSGSETSGIATKKITLSPHGHVPSDIAGKDHVPFGQQNCPPLIQD